jgi:hypothetical protein
LKGKKRRREESGWRRMLHTFPYIYQQRWRRTFKGKFEKAKERGEGRKEIKK